MHSSLFTLLFKTDSSAVTFSKIIHTVLTHPETCIKAAGKFISPSPYISIRERNWES